MTLGDGIVWDITEPADTDLRSLGAAEIRDLRTALGIRVSKEHDTLAAASAGGEHKEGSAKAYYDIASTFPTNRPDAATPLTDADIGRIAIIDGVLYAYTGTTDDWGTRRGSITMAAAYDTPITVGMPFVSILFHAGGPGMNFCVVTAPLVDQTLSVFAFEDNGTTKHQYDVDIVQTDPTYTFRIRNNPSTTTSAHRYHVLI